MFAAMVPPAPGRLSTTTCCFQFSVSFCAMKRAVISGTPPGVKPTTMRIGLPGKPAAGSPPAGCAAPISSDMAVNNTATRETLLQNIFIAPPADNYETGRQAAFARRSPRPPGEGLGVMDRAMLHSYVKLDISLPHPQGESAWALSRS